jgi:hypothetical protein
MGIGSSQSSHLINDSLEKAKDPSFGLTKKKPEANGLFDG